MPPKLSCYVAAACQRFSANPVSRNARTGIDAATTITRSRNRIRCRGCRRLLWPQSVYNTVTRSRSPRSGWRCKSYPARWPASVYARVSRRGPWSSTNRSCGASSGEPCRGQPLRGISAFHPHARRRRDRAHCRRSSCRGEEIVASCGAPFDYVTEEGAQASGRRASQQ